MQLRKSFLSSLIEFRRTFCLDAKSSKKVKASWCFPKIFLVSSWRYDHGLAKGQASIAPTHRLSKKVFPQTALCLGNSMTFFAPLLKPERFLNGKPHEATVVESLHSHVKLSWRRFENFWGHEFTVTILFRAITVIRGFKPSPTDKTRMQWEGLQIPSNKIKRETK